MSIKILTGSATRLSRREKEVLMDGSLNIAVIGTGVMGSNHLRVLNRLEEANIAAVVDADIVRAEEAAREFGVRAFATVSEMLNGSEKIDGAVVATPTRFHIENAKELVSSGVAVLVEKPVSLSITEAEALDALAVSHRVPVTGGHVERFNPVIIELMNSSYRPIIHIDIRRIGPFSSRINDNVIHDLMIHDLDVVRNLVGSPLASVQATGRAVLTDSYDLAVTLLVFESGVTASLTASRLGQKKVRQIDVTLENSQVSGDLLHQTVVAHQANPGKVTSGGSGFTQESIEEVRYLENRTEPLAAELRDFFSAIASERLPLVTVKDGIEAVKMAQQVTAAADSKLL